MLHLISKEAPGFSADVVLPNNRIESNFCLSSLRGRYVVLFFYPLDFTFVCPTEILAFDEKLDEFKTRNAEVVGISVDSVYSHLAWKNTPTDRGGIGPIRYPLISDLQKTIATDFGVLMDDGVALRAVFLIDREGLVRHASLNDLPLGRNVSEILRLLDAWRFYEEQGQLCPANWEKGRAGMDASPAGVVDYLTRFAKAK